MGEAEQAVQLVLEVMHWVQFESQGVHVVPTRKYPDEQALVQVLDAVLKIEKEEMVEL